MGNRLSQLANEYSHRGTGRVPTREEIQNAINVGTGRVPNDIAYSEKPLGGGFDIGEVGGIPINATDFIPADLGANALTKLALLGKGALGIGLAGTAKNVGKKLSQVVSEDAVRTIPKTEYEIGISKPISTRLEDFAGENAQEKYKNMQNAWSQYNKERANTLISELDKRGIKTSGTGILSSNEPYTTWENASGLQSLYMKVPGYGEIRFSDHVGPSELSQGKTFNTPDEALNAIKNAYDKKYARDLEIDSLRKQMGIVEGSDKENMKVIQDWLKNNPQQGQMKDPGWWKQKLDLGLGWSPSKLITSNPFDKTNILSGMAAGTIGLPLLYGSNNNGD